MRCTSLVYTHPKPLVNAQRKPFPLERGCDMCYNESRGRLTVASAAPQPNIIAACTITSSTRWRPLCCALPVPCRHQGYEEAAMKARTYRPILPLLALMGLALAACAQATTEVPLAHTSTALPATQAPTQTPTASVTDTPAPSPTLKIVVATTTPTAEPPTATPLPTAASPSRR